MNVGHGIHGSVHQLSPRRVEKRFTCSDAESRIINELEATRRLSHPGILHTRRSGPRAISMRYLNNRNYCNWRSLERLADVIDYAHQQGVVHCDIGHGNYVETRMRVYLIDWSAAKFSRISHPDLAYSVDQKDFAYFRRADLMSLAYMTWDYTHGEQRTRYQQVDDGRISPPTARQLIRYIRIGLV